MNRSTLWLRLGIVVAVLGAGLLMIHYWGYGLMGSSYGSHWPMYQGGRGGGGMMGYGVWGMGSGFGSGMILFWVIVVAAVIWLVSAILPRSNHNNQTNQPACQLDDALEVLKKRYARGDIDKAEFEAKRRDLKA